MFEWVNKNGMLMSQASYCMPGHTCYWVGWEHGWCIISAILFPHPLWKNIKRSHLCLSQDPEQLRWKSLTFFPPSWAARTVLEELTNHEASRPQTRPTHNVTHATNAMCNGQFSGISIKSSPSDIEVFFGK